MFKGSIVALITPFRDGQVDEDALRKLVDWHVEQGTHGIVPCGTTGESPTLSHEEHGRVVEIVIDQVAGRLPIIAGAGSNNTAEAISLTQHAQAAGADAVLHVAGYYNRPNQEGLYQHFKALHDASDIPIIIYNIPPRAIVDILPETMARLAELPRIAGVKDATCDGARISRERLLIGSGFCHLSGEDPTSLAYNAHGGHGCISVSAKCGAETVRGISGGLPGRRFRPRTDPARASDAVAYRAVPGTQPGRGQICRLAPWPVRGGSAPAGGASDEGDGGKDRRCLASCGFA